ncbi:MAG: hypothetical protein ACI304_05650 [Lepagella sp.]
MKVVRNSLLMALAILSLSFLASCNSDSSDEKNNSVVDFLTYNLYTSSTTGEVVSTQRAIYRFGLYYSSKTIDITANAMKVSGETTASFVTGRMPFTYKSFMVDNFAREVISFHDAAPVTDGAPVSNLNGRLTQAFNYVLDIPVPGYNILVAVGTLHNVVMQYNLNEDLIVRTFWPDVTFCGMTSVNSKHDLLTSYSNSKISYRVAMHLDKDGKILDKADMIIYNLALSDNVLPKTVVIKDLDLKFGGFGYEVSGKNLSVLALSTSGQELVDDDSIKFDNFYLSTTTDMTGANITYKVNDEFTGACMGYCEVQDNTL